MQLKTFDKVIELQKYPGRENLIAGLNGVLTPGEKKSTPIVTFLIFAVSAIVARDLVNAVKFADENYFRNRTSL